MSNLCTHFQFQIELHQQCHQYIHEQILIPGDVNRDGIINSLDIIMILSHLNGSIELTDNQFFYADMDADTEITHNDVVLLVNELLLADL